MISEDLVDEVNELLEEDPPMVDYWRCEDKKPHKWLYLGKRAQSYRCENCLQKVTKAELKEETDHA